MLKAVKRIQGAGRNNTYYKINGEITLLNLNNKVVVIVDTKWVPELKNLSISYRYRNDGRLDPYCKFQDTSNKNCYVQLGKIVYDLEHGKVKDLHKNMIYPYDKEECHHKYARIDNRACAVESLTKEAHTKVHMNKYGGSKKSHNILDLKITYRINTDTGEVEEYYNKNALEKYLKVYR